MNKALAFNNKRLEREYNSMKNATHLKCFTYAFGSFLLYDILIYFINPLKIDLLSPDFLLPMIITKFVLIGFYALVRTKFSSKTSFSMIVLSLCFIIGTAETHKAGQSAARKSNAFFEQITGNACLVILSGHSRWFHKLITIVLLNAYWGLRFNFENSLADIDQTYCASVCVQIIMLFSTVHEQDKVEKTLFIENWENIFHKRSYESMVKNIITSSVIIYKNEKIAYFNEATRNLFDITSDVELKPILEAIKLVQKIEYNHFNSLNYHTEHINSESYSFTLQELMKDWELHNKIETEENCCNFISFEGEMTASDEINLQRSFSVQVGNSYWEGEKSLMIIINDFTPIKRHYKYLNIYKDNFLASISHNLRTPLNWILGTLEVLYVGGDPSIEKYDVISSSTKLLLSMVNDIIDFSMISKGTIKLSPQACNLSSFVNETLGLFSLQANSKQLNIIIEKDLQCQNYLLDHERLRQILVNLIGNAIKYTNQGSIWVRIRDEIIESQAAFPADTQNKKKRRRLSEINEEDWILGKLQAKLIFEVEDTGIGIHPSEIENLFKLVNKINAREVQDHKGIGFGLSISQYLVRLMNANRLGAEIEVFSEPGKGSRFSFPIYAERLQDEFIREFTEHIYIPMSLKSFKSKSSLPISTKMNDQSADIEIVSNAKALKKASVKSVLIIDDDQINLLVASNFLKSNEGMFAYETATNGQVALEKVKESARLGNFFDVFLMDCNMPIMDGYETTRILKLMMHNQTIKQAPIVAITANAGNTDREKCFSSGMDFFLTKPYSKNQLMSTLEEVLRS